VGPGLFQGLLEVQFVTDEEALVGDQAPARGPQTIQHLPGVVALVQTHHEVGGQQTRLMGLTEAVPAVAALQDAEIGVGVAVDDGQAVGRGLTALPQALHHALQEGIGVVVAPSDHDRDQPRGHDLLDHRGHPLVQDRAQGPQGGQFPGA